jgi:hypothetical protein
VASIGLAEALRVLAVARASAKKALPTIAVMLAARDAYLAAAASPRSLRAMETEGEITNRPNGTSAGEGNAVAVATRAADSEASSEAMAAIDAKALSRAAVCFLSRARKEESAFAAASPKKSSATECTDYDWIRVR